MTISSSSTRRAALCFVAELVDANPAVDWRVAFTAGRFTHRALAALQLRSVAFVERDVVRASLLEQFSTVCDAARDGIDRKVADAIVDLVGDWIGHNHADCGPDDDVETVTYDARSLLASVDLAAGLVDDAERVEDLVGHVIDTLDDAARAHAEHHWFDPDDLLHAAGVAIAVAARGEAA